VGDATDVQKRNDVSFSLLDRLGLDDPEIRACIYSAIVLGTGMKSLPRESECLKWVAAYRDGKMGFSDFCNNLEGWLVAFDREELEKIAEYILSGHALLEPSPGVVFDPVLADA
jgi:hypothetical protein